MKSLPLVAHWRLNGNADDALGHHHGKASSVQWTQGPDGRPNSAALFNGKDSVVEVADAPELQLGSGAFTVAAWVRCAKPMKGAFGDILSKFDAQRRCGLNLWVNGGSAGYNSFGDARHVHAGIDDGYMGPWQDLGNPALDNPLIPCLTVYRGELYAGVSDAQSPEHAGKVFRWSGGRNWVDCGRLGTNPHHISAMSMIVHDGHMYAGTGMWDWGRADQARLSNPPISITRVYRYEGGTTWRDMGAVGQGQRVLCMASFDGSLYAAVDRGGQGRCFKLVNDQWIDCGVLDDRDNFECLMPVGGVLYGASHFAVYRYDGGQKWTCVGRRPFGISQIHAFQVYAGKLWIGTWPQGYILRYEGGETWTNTGLVGLATDRPGVHQINEINSLGVHNGKLYAGVLPKAQVYRYEADGQWTLIDNLATHPNWDPATCPTWTRVLTLLTHKGLLFACTGASQARTQDIDADHTVGRVLASQTGMVASHEQDIGDAWTHVAAVRTLKDIKLYINGQLAHRMPAPKRRYFDLGNAEPLRIGAGTQSSFDGAISDVRLYGNALSAARVLSLWKLRGQDSR